MMESEPIVAKFWAAFDAFIPGEPAQTQAHPGPIPAAPVPRPLRMPKARGL